MTSLPLSRHPALKPLPRRLVWRASPPLQRLPHRSPLSRNPIRPLPALLASSLLRLTTRHSTPADSSAPPSPRLPYRYPPLQLSPSPCVKRLSYLTPTSGVSPSMLSVTPFSLPAALGRLSPYPEATLPSLPTACSDTSTTATASLYDARPGTLPAVTAKSPVTISLNSLLQPCASPNCVYSSLSAPTSRGVPCNLMSSRPSLTHQLRKSCM